MIPGPGVIPPDHHRAVALLLAGAQLLEIDGGGHYPHETAAGRLLPAVRRILATTAPFRYTESRWRELLAPDATAAI